MLVVGLGQKYSDCFSIMEATLPLSEYLENALPDSADSNDLLLERMRVNESRNKRRRVWRWLNPLRVLEYIQGGETEVLDLILMYLSIISLEILQICNFGHR
ncbi:uncharacterized protein Bfra_007645 [Botrytis fragariae]|uniref:Uncharacterized protein n=1 Tax=Botrytis fragariae TaxID=1964551 RepID=A0A8H6APG8_9HELO|nr:uncharacterized protein Bfra_007645 [Botrytis fragariae]KAF5871131.1 hypothetical protein Bfra_007645 [Botrytis fragariae]